ncbi:hypothetical protein [uncultured Albimonas sp.]|uniref:hypothetical protein n=1 Tax=uncultured Albimonas sp. TaxID=1331701 RepID=UPI0030EFA2FA|tara:strand:- start:1312 stop:1965 length:654 start_codon:yes stop_codon:yes gene_type:complete
MYRVMLAAVVFATAPCLAAASAVYTTTVDYDPEDLPWSSDPADGDRIVIEWSAAATSGTVDETSVQDLTFHLYGDGALLWTDVAIVGGVFQPIDGQVREQRPPYMIPNGITFEFDLDAWALDPTDGLGAFDNDGPQVQNDGTGITWNLYSSWNSGVLRANALEFDAYGSDTANSTRGPITSVATTLAVTAVPLPAALPMALAGIAALAGLSARGRRG